jgi:hypothetical protein
VALTAIYLNAQNVPITDTTPGATFGNPITITASSPISVPDGAAGVQIGLGACQPAAFGGVIGHPRYTIAVNALAGQPSVAATNTPGPTATSYPTDTPTPPVPTSTPTSTATNSPTATPTSTMCTVHISIPSPLDQNNGYYTTFTTSAPGDITATWTITTNSSSGNLYLYLYRGTTSLGASSGMSTTDPNSVTPGTSTIDPVSLGATNDRQVEALDYTANTTGHPSAAAGTYTVYFYNNNNKTDDVSGATVSYMSSSCPGSPTATPTTGPSATPSASPTSTATVSPPTATPTPGRYPYSVSAAPDGTWCNGLADLIQPEIEPTGSLPDAKYQPEEYYCRGVYSIGSHVVVYANGVGLGNNYGHDSNFKGYIGHSSVWYGLTHNLNSSAAFDQLFNDEVDTPEPAGEGNNGPSAPCPTKMDLPLISRIAHHGNGDWFAPLGLVRVTIDNPSSCGNPTTGVISGVVYDPDQIVNLPSGATLPYLP